MNRSLALYESGDIGLDTGSLGKYNKGNGLLLANILGNYLRNKIHDYDPEHLERKGYIENKQAKEGPHVWMPDKKLILPNEYKNDDSVNWDVDYLSGYENVGRFILSGIATAALKSIPTTEGTAPDAIKNSMHKASRMLFYTSSKNISPFLAQRYGFWKGFSNTENYYTVEIDIGGNKIERPLFPLTKGEQPNIRFIKDSAKSAFIQPDSHSNAMNASLSRLYNDVCAYTGADIRYTNGDLRGLEDLSKIWGRFAKLDMHNIHQFGKEFYVTTIPIDLPAGTTINGMTLPMDVTLNGKVKRYEKAKGFGTYITNEAGNWGYDLMDVWFYNLVQGLFGTQAARQMGVEEQLESHIKTKTVLSHLFGGRKPLPHYT